MKTRLSLKYFENDCSLCSLRTLIKNQIEDVSGLTVWNAIKFVFIVSASPGLSKFINTKVMTT